MTLGHTCGWCGKLVVGWYDEAVFFTGESVVFLHHPMLSTEPTCYMRYMAERIEAQG